MTIEVKSVSSSSPFEETVRRILRDELGKYYYKRMGFGDFEYNILFYKYGYMPHFAEHVVDPRDGREKLMMADPHIRRSAFIYDLRNREIEWEFTVPGTTMSSNPHVARMLLEDVPDIGAEAGDIICADRDNRWILIDRDKKEVKWTLTQPDADWAHDILLAKDKAGFIITNYGEDFVRKVGFDGSVIWERADIGDPAKISVVEGTTTSGGHSNSFGGDYLVAGNWESTGVYELRDSDGEIVWRAGAFGGLNVFFTMKPHSAFRLGLVELEGNLTVIGFEAGGGIVAIDRNCRPRWGFMKPQTDGFPKWIYRPTTYGLMETFHVFPTLWGTVGAVDASGKWASKVIEITHWPRKTTLWFCLAQDHDPGDEGTYYDPPLETFEWDEVYITFINRGENPLDYEIRGTKMMFLIEGDWPSHWDMVDYGTVDSGAIKNVIVDSKWVALRVFGKRTTAGSGSNWKIIVTFVRK